MSGDRERLTRMMADSQRDPQELYQALWEHYYPRLLTYIGSFKQIDPDDYGDIVSDILLKLFRNLEKYHSVYALSTWVYAVARNHILDVLRKNRYIRRVPIEEVHEKYLIDCGAGHDILGNIIKQDEIEACRQVIDSLKEEEKRLIFLRYYEELNSREIAMIEGVSAGAIRQRLMAIKGVIKKRMGDVYETHYED